MLIGLGLDITEIAKLSNHSRRQAFMRRVFTNDELRSLGGSRNRAEHLAGKFAAKEAFMKAVGAGIRQEVGFTQIEVLNDEFGKPFLRLSGEARSRLDATGAARVHVSISHSAGVAVAVVILES